MSSWSIPNWLIEYDVHAIAAARGEVLVIEGAV